MWESSAGGLGTRRHPWAQTDAMAEDGGVGCPERGRGGSGQKCRQRGGSSKRQDPDRQARGKAKEKGRRETGGRGQGGRQPEIARGSPGEGGPRSHGSGPTRQGCGRHATGRLRSAVSLEKHCEPAAGWRGAAGAAYRFSESRRRGGAAAQVRSPSPHSEQAQVGKLLLPQPGLLGHAARHSGQSQTTKHSCLCNSAP